jgi:hypothetical protein
LVGVVDSGLCPRRSGRSADGLASVKRPPPRSRSLPVPTIGPDELTRRSRIRFESIRERDLVDWLVDEQLAVLDQHGRLAPTARAVELGGSLHPLGEHVPA